MKAFSTTALAAVLALAGPTGQLQAQVEAQVQAGPSVEALEAARDLLVLMSRDLVAHLAGQVTTQMWPAIESRLRAYNPNIDAEMDACAAEINQVTNAHQIEAQRAAYRRHLGL